MVNQGAFITYLRVSTQQQGRSGLGLEAQRQAVASYLGSNGCRIIGEYVEVESGRRSDRPQLDAALTAARMKQVPLVVAKVDRLTRSLSFLLKLLDAGVDVRFADLPQIEGATGRFMLQQMAAVAELEAGMISDRTKKALAAARKRGVKLGGWRGYSPLNATAVAKSVATRQDRAAKRAVDLAPIVEAAQAAGATSLRALAAELDRQHIPAPRGGSWNAKQVSRLLEQIEDVEELVG
jgi:DNA invertase Pin-like site-specific DNA recombinase